MAAKKSAQDVTYALGADGVAVLTIDVPGERMNILKESFYQSVHAALDKVESDNEVKAAVIISGKSDSFIAGADIKIIETIDSIERATELCQQGHELMNRVANSKKPIVAAINSVCLGGGFELALACHARVLSDNAKTMVGLPEVKLGVLPGFGGSQRLPRLVGILPALDMMLTGRTIVAKKAKRMGIADEVVPNTILLTVAEQKALAMTQASASAGLLNHLSVASVKALLLEKNSHGRQFVCSQARKQTLAKTHGNYPAPLKIIDLVQRGLGMPLDKALELEIQSFAELAITPESKQLIHIYFAHTALKKDNFIKSDAEPRKVKRMGVLGGGLMGSGIAVVSLDKANADVRIKDISDDGIRASIAHVSQYYQAKLKRRSISKADMRHKLSRFTGTTDYSGFKRADLVIEAVFEDLKLKKQMLKDIENLGNEDTVFATNTSSIPIKNIARGAMRPENVIGMHYFSPVEKMPLLEIIKHNRTSDETIATAVNFGRAQGKTVIVVKDVAGFFVNRILFPYINEAGHLLMEGVPVDVIDKAMAKFGFPVGPFKLLDEVGLAVGAKVQHILQGAYGDRMQGTEVVDKLLNAGHQGKKSRKGFYSYNKKDKGKVVDPDVYKVLGVSATKSLNQDEIVKRCILPLLNEAAYCLDEKVINSARDGDIGSVFGIGFPPFRGGPFRYIDTIGTSVILTQLQEYESQYGQRFTPAEGLKKLAEKNNTSYYK